MSTAAAEDRLAAPAARTDPFPILALPRELRYEIFRSCLISDSSTVEVVSNYLDGKERPTKIQFYTIRNLSLLEANKQCRAEAGEVFYAENIFTLHSYSRTQEYGQKPFYGRKAYWIDYSRVRKAHILTPRGFFPPSFDSCVLGAARMRAFLESIAEVLAGQNCMAYMLLQSYDFEKISFCTTPTAARWDLVQILEPLEKVRGLKMCHIRAMKIGHWPYLRFLEREMTTPRSIPQNFRHSQRHIVERALTCKGIMTAAGINGFGGPDLPFANKIFQIFNAKPLYEDLDFIDLFDDDILNAD